MDLRRVSLLIALTAVACAARGPRFEGPLRVHPENPRYLTDGSGRPIYLTGSHTWLNVQDAGIKERSTPFDNGEFLDTVVGHGHNFVRLWLWESTYWIWPAGKSFTVIDPMPFRRTGPGLARDGKPRFDLGQLDPAFFERLRARVQAARDRGVYVGLMLFQGFSVARKAKTNGNPWPGHPFHRDNNINGIDGDLDGDGEGYEAHTLTNPAVTRIQDAYVRRIVDALNGFDNVIYEICNEGRGDSTDWQHHVAQVLREHEARMPRQHLTWMSYQWDPRAGENATLFKAPVEVVSPSAHREEAYFLDPPAATGAKVVILDTDHIEPLKVDRAVWVWKAFMRGNHPIFMDDPHASVQTGYLEPRAAATRRAMGQTLRFARQVALAAMTPATDGASCSTRYCLVSSGREYLVFQPETGPFMVRLEPGTYRLAWFDPMNERVVPGSPVSGGSSPRHLEPPFAGPAVAHLVAAR